MIIIPSAAKHYMIRCDPRDPNKDIIYTTHPPDLFSSASPKSITLFQLFRSFNFSALDSLDASSSIKVYKDDDISAYRQEHPTGEKSTFYY